jgi:hypothetical protein
MIEILSHLWHWFEVHTGTVNESGPYYGFWSGFGSDIGEITLLGAVIAGMKHLNCHNKGCPWPGRHTTSEGYKLCKRCISKSRDELTLHKIHEDHR